MMNDIFHNILVYLKNEEHEKHVCLVLLKLHNTRIYVKLKKCVFDKPQVKFLGYIISSEGVMMDLLAQSMMVNIFLVWKLSLYLHPKLFFDCCCAHWIHIKNLYIKYHD